MSELALGDEGRCAGLAGADLAAGWGPHGADSLRGLESGVSPGDRELAPVAPVAPFPPTITTSPHLTSTEERRLEKFHNNNLLLRTSLFIS